MVSGLAWTDEDFTVLKIDTRNAFNFVLARPCCTHFPELLPWASWPASFVEAPFRYHEL